MALFELQLEVPTTLSELFDILVRPASMERLTPEDANMELVSGPKIVELGTEVIWKIKRFGLSQEVTYQVTEIEKNRFLVIEQIRGPLGKWIHSQELVETDGGVLLTDTIEFEKPKGLLGFTVTEDWIRSDLETNFRKRNENLRAHFSRESEK